METLSKLFGSAVRVKILRLFLFHPGEIYDVDMVVKRVRGDSTSVKKEIAMLASIGFVKKRATRTILKSGKKKPAQGYMLSESFPLSEPLATLLIDSELVGGRDIATRFQAAGRVKLLITSGIFNQDSRSNNGGVDILIVGDRFTKTGLDKVVTLLEAEVGKELRYVVFSPEEFAYRMDMYDSFLRDIFNGPHEKVVNTMGDIVLR